MSRSLFTPVPKRDHGHVDRIVTAVGRPNKAIDSRSTALRGRSAHGRPFKQGGRHGADRSSTATALTVWSTQGRPHCGGGRPQADRSCGSRRRVVRPSRAVDARFTDLRGRSGRPGRRPRAGRSNTAVDYKSTVVARRSTSRRPFSRGGRCRVDLSNTAVEVSMHMLRLRSTPGLPL